jgi:hypothetical protein
MIDFLQEFLASKQLQDYVAGGLVFAVVWGLKHFGVLTQTGNAFKRRLGVAIGATLLLVVRTYVEWQVNGTAPEWGAVLASIIGAWIAATAGHALTRKPKPEG